MIDGSASGYDCHGTFDKDDVEESVFVPLLHDGNDNIFNMYASGSLFRTLQALLCFVVHMRRSLSFSEIFYVSLKARAKVFICRGRF